MTLCWGSKPPLGALASQGTAADSADAHGTCGFVHASVIGRDSVSGDAGGIPFHGRVRSILKAAREARGGPLSRSRVRRAPGGKGLTGSDRGGSKQAGAHAERDAVAGVGAGHDDARVLWQARE